MAKPFRVLHVIDSLAQSGGSERQLVRNLQLFSDPRLEHEVVYLYPRPGDDRTAEVPNSARVTGLTDPKERTPGRLRLIRRLCSLVGRERPDLIHCTLANASLAARIAGLRHRVPVVESLVNLSYEPIRRADNPAIRPWKFAAYRGLDKLTMRSVTRFHAVSGAVAESWARYVGLPPAKIQVIPRGLDLEALRQEWEQARSRNDVLASLGLSSDSFVLINVGRQDAQKGHLYALQAMPRIAQTVPSAVFLIAGADGNTTPRLLEAMAHLHLEGHVLLLGHRADAAQLLGAADAFLFPSLFEGMPGALLEAMYAGLPCVAFDLPPMDEVLTDGVTGILVEPRSSTALADALTLLAGDEALRRRLGAAARAEVESKYSAHEAAAALERLYLEILEAH